MSAKCQIPNTRQINVKCPTRQLDVIFWHGQLNVLFRNVYLSSVQVMSNSITLKQNSAVLPLKRQGCPPFPLPKWTFPFLNLTAVCILLLTDRTVIDWVRLVSVIKCSLTCDVTWTSLYVHQLFHHVFIKWAICCIP